MSSAPDPRPSWYGSTFAIALVGSLLLWAALPPLALGWLGWIAPVPWLVLIRMENLPGRRPYGALYLAGLVFWLLAIHWLRLPHPAVYLGWVALSAWLAIYLPLFVGLSRVAVHQLRLPLWLAAPVVFTGLELARAHLLTGFLMGSLAHTQVHFTPLIQISDLFGEYGVDFVMMLVASCIALLLPHVPALSSQRAGASPPPTETTPLTPRKIIQTLTPAAIILCVTLLYGRYRLNEIARVESQSPPTVRIALIQGNSLADWKFDQAKQQQIMDEYIGLSKQAVGKAKSDGRPLDLIVWPETMYRYPLREFDRGFDLPPNSNDTIEEITAADRRNLADLVSYLQTPMLVGIDRIHFLASESLDASRPDYEAYNSAALVDAKGNLVGTYDKFHLVMFGEYVPFSKWLPFLKRLSSLTGSVEAGAGPVALCLHGVCYAPNICYETVIPHVIRRQANAIAEASEQPGVLVNMTNDAWYWGSSELAQHLACGVFRAIETRRPLVIAANGGISAWIDDAGRIRAQSPRQKPDIIIADVQPSHAHSWYMQFGDWFAGACLMFCVALVIVGWRGRQR